MEVRVVGVGLEYLDHDHGHWCNQCLLSTGIRVWIAVRTENRMHLQQRLWCHECEGNHVTVVGGNDVRHC